MDSLSRGNIFFGSLIILVLLRQSLLPQKAVQAGRTEGRSNGRWEAVKLSQIGPFNWLQTNWHNGQEEKLNLKVPNYALFIRKTNLPFYKHFGLCVKPFPASCPQQLWWGLSFSEFNHVSLGKCCWSITTKEFDEIRKQIERENEDSPFVLWND